MNERYEELQRLGDEFLARFNRGDVDGIMAFFTDDAVYEEFHGRNNSGKAEIRTSFERLFNGTFGEIRFVETDTFIDAAAGKVMSSWLLHLNMDGKPVVLSGLDLLYFEGDKIARKLTYAKAQAGLYEAA